jgi:hypothetical protein
MALVAARSLVAEPEDVCILRRPFVSAAQTSTVRVLLINSLPFVSPAVKRHKLEVPPGTTAEAGTPGYNIRRRG